MLHNESAESGDLQRSHGRTICKAAFLRSSQADMEDRDIDSAVTWHGMQDRTRGPQFGRMEIAKEHIGRLVGPNGSVLRGIEDSTGAGVTLQEDGVVHYFGPTPEKFKAAEETIGSITGNTIKALPLPTPLSPVRGPKSRSLSPGCRGTNARVCAGGRQVPSDGEEAAGLRRVCRAAERLPDPAAHL